MIESGRDLLIYASSLEGGRMLAPLAVVLDD
jgi:hypothetical protein